MRLCDSLIGLSILALSLMSCAMLWSVAHANDPVDVDLSCIKPHDVREDYVKAGAAPLEIGRELPAAMRVVQRYVKPADGYLVLYHEGRVERFVGGCAVSTSLDERAMKALLGDVQLAMLGRLK